MIVETRIGFRADVVPQRARKVRKAFVEDTIATRIDDIGIDEAPVALTYRVDDGVRRSVRVRDGVMWEMAIRPKSGGSDTDNLPPELRNLEGIEYRISEFVSSAGLDGIGDTSTTGGRATHPDARIVSSTRDETAYVVQKWADENLLTIGGIPHVRARSPLLSGDDVVSGFGAETASDVGMHTGMHVPAWFAPAYDGRPLGKVLSNVRRRDDVGSAIALDLLDVEIVRPDLMAECLANEAANTNPQALVAALWRSIRNVAIGSHDFSAGDKIPLWRSLVLRRLGMASYAAAASDGATFLDAARTLRGVMVPPRGASQDLGRIMMPAPDDAVRRETTIFFHGQGNGHGAATAGWRTIGYGPRMAEKAMPSVLEPEQLVEIATVGNNRYFADDAGRIVVDPHHPLPGKPRQGKGTSLKRHAQDLAEAAAGLAGHGSMPIPQDDHLGEAIRHFNGCRPLDSDEARAETIREFVHHRVVLVGDMLHLRCPEPTILVEEAPSRIRPWVGHSLAYRYRPGKTPPFMFRLDEAEDAMDAARGLGPVDETRIADLSLAAPGRLSFDSALWNLKAATRRIVDDLDQRTRLFDPQVHAAILRMDRHLAVWCEDGSEMSGEDETMRFLLDAGVLLDALGNPLMEDIGSDHVRRIASASLERALGERRIVDTEHSDEYVGFSM